MSNGLVDIWNDGERTYESITLDGKQLYSLGDNLGHGDAQWNATLRSLLKLLYDHSRKTLDFFCGRRYTG